MEPSRPNPPSESPPSQSPTSGGWTKYAYPSYWWSGSAGGEVGSAEEYYALQPSENPIGDQKESDSLEHKVRIVDQALDLGDDWVVMDEHVTKRNPSARPAASNPQLHLAPLPTADPAVDSPSTTEPLESDRDRFVTRRKPKHIQQSSSSKPYLPPLKDVNTTPRKTVEEAVAIASAASSLANSGILTPQTPKGPLPPLRTTTQPCSPVIPPRSAIASSALRPSESKSNATLPPPSLPAKSESPPAPAIIEPLAASSALTGTPLSFIDFAYSAEQADEIFKQWRDQLWLAPGSISAALLGAQRKAIFLPYRSFSGVAITKTKADSPVSGKSTAQTFVDYLWAAHQLDAVPSDVLKEVEPFLIKSARSLSVTKALGVVVGSRAGETPTILPSENVEETWSKASVTLGNFMSRKAEKRLGTEATETSFEDVTSKVVLTPLYVYTYMYEGSQYFFLVNGQTGHSHGQKPFGVGSFPKALAKLLTGAVFGASGSTKALLLPGAQIEAMDKTPEGIYAPGAFYVVPPPSDQFLLVSATGWIALRNSGDKNLVLHSQWRGSPESAHLRHRTILPAGRRVVYDYVGSWVIRILEGDPSQLVIDACETSGGGSGSNELSMASPPTPPPSPPKMPESGESAPK